MEFNINEAVKVKEDHCPDSDDYVPGSIGVMVRMAGDRVTVLGTESLFTVDPDALEEYRPNREQADALREALNREVEAHPYQRALHAREAGIEKMVRVARRLGDSNSERMRVERMFRRMGLPSQTIRAYEVNVRYNINRSSGDQRQPWHSLADTFGGIGTLTFRVEVEIDLPADFDGDDTGCVCESVTAQMVADKAKGFISRYTNGLQVDGLSLHSYMSLTCAQHHDRTTALISLND